MMSTLWNNGCPLQSKYLRRLTMDISAKKIFQTLLASVDSIQELTATTNTVFKQMFFNGSDFYSITKSTQKNKHRMKLMKIYNNNCRAYNFRSRTDQGRFNRVKISKDRQIYIKLMDQLQVPHGPEHIIVSTSRSLWLVEAQKDRSRHGIKL